MVFASGLDTRGAWCAGDLFVTDSDLRDPRLLLRQPCRQRAPVWSPDGSSIAYESSGGIWVADADGNNAREAIKPLRSRTDGGTGTLAYAAWQPENG